MSIPTRESGYFESKARIGAKVNSVSYKEERFK